MNKPALLLAVHNCGENLGTSSSSMGFRLSRDAGPLELFPSLEWRFACIQGFALGRSCGTRRAAGFSLVESAGADCRTVKVLTEAAEEKIDQFQLMGLSNIFWALSVLHCSHLKLFKKLAQSIIDRFPQRTTRIDAPRTRHPIFWFERMCRETRKGSL